MKPVKKVRFNILAIAKLDSDGLQFGLANDGKDPTSLKNNKMTYVFDRAVLRLNFDKEQRIISFPELCQIAHHSSLQVKDRFKLARVPLKVKKEKK